MRQVQAADTIIADLEKPGAPGGAAGVIVDGELVWSRGFGLADLDRGAAFGDETAFHICSITKTFTGVLLGLLEADGVLSMDDPVRAHLPDFPDYGAPVTLRHLVTNTSGLRDYFPLMFLEQGRAPASYDRAPMERHALTQPSLMFEPGERYSYSNSNFVVLCRLMEKLTGRAYGDLARERILGPLGMDGSEFRTQTVPEPRGAALGYFEDGQGGFRAPRLDVHEAGDGGMWSTIRDLDRYGAALVAGRLGPPGMVARLTTPPILGSGQRGWYACGFGTGEHGGARWFGHAGGLSGMSTNLACFPDHRAAVVTAFNGPAGDAEALGLRLAEVFLEIEAAPRRVAPEPLRVETWAGCWQDERAGVTAELTVQGEGVRLWQFGWDLSLVPAAEDLLVDPESDAAVRRLSDEEVELCISRGSRVRLRRLPPGEAPPPEGRYEGVEVRAVYEISGGALVVHGEAGASPPYPLKAAAKGVWHLMRPDGARSGVVVTARDDALIVSMSKAERVCFRRVR